jgi:integrase
MLTPGPQKYYPRFTMAGNVRTKECCPKCGNNFTGAPLTCPTCQTAPRRYYLDLPWRGEKIRLYSDQDGYPLDSYDRAARLLSHVRYQIDHQVFDSRNYVKRDLRALRFETYAAAWLTRRQLEQDRGHLSRSYIRSCSTWLSRLNQFFGHINIREINEGHLEDFLNTLPPELAPKTVSNILGILHKILADALRRRDIQRLPGFPRISVPETQIKWITREEQEEVLKHVKCTVTHACFTFLMFTGCRPGEARALRWEDINWKNQTVTIHAAMDQEEYRPCTKEKDVRLLPLHPTVLSVISRLPRNISGYVFTLNGIPLTGNQIYKAWMRSAAKAGININLYQGTKHSLGCQLLNSGVREDVLQALFGHKDRKSTKRYAKMVSDSLKYWEE